MTPDQITLIGQRAHRQVDAGRCFCHITAEETAALADGYSAAIKQRDQLIAAVLDLDDRLARIEAIVKRTWVPFCDNDRPTLWEALREIELLSSGT